VWQPCVSSIDLNQRAKGRSLTPSLKSKEAAMPVNRRDFLKLAGLGLGGTLLAPGQVFASGGAGDAVNHFAMLYDATKCIGCNACSNGCRAWNNTTPEPDPSGLYDAPRELSADTWTLIQAYQGDSEYSFVKHQCMHCIDPACVSACPVHALTKTDTGPVVYDADRCIGCRYCMLACPFHVPRFEWDEVIPVIAKCTFCADRLEVGDGPNCAEFCPTGALIWGRRGEMLAEAEGRLAVSPDRYVDHVYGKEEAGGTSVLYLSSVPFEKLGLPELDAEPIPEVSEGVGNIIIPGIVFGGPLILAGIRYLARPEGEA
jgi:formate dehydrogenase beta subunit